MSRKKYGLWFVSLAVIFSMLFLVTPVPAYAQTVDVTPIFGGLLSGTESRITTDNADQNDPAISGDIIVYTDYRGADADIWYYNLATSTEHPVTTAPGNQVLTDVSSGTIAYNDFDLGDVFVYDTGTGINTNITNNHGTRQAQNPAIGGKLVAWEDSRNNASSSIDIYAKDLATGEERRVSDMPGTERWPAVAGGIIVFGSQTSPTSMDIYAYDWATGAITRITNTPDRVERDPDTNGSAVVYASESASTGEKDICYYDLATGEEKRLLLPGDQVNPNISGDYVTFEDLIGVRYHVRVWHVPTGYVFDLNIPTTSSQFLNDIDGNRIVYIDDRGGQLDVYLFTFNTPTCDIEVAPASVQFGDVTIGTSTTQIVTITNTGNANLNVYYIEPIYNIFGYKVSVGLDKIPPGGTGEIYVYFSPQFPGPASSTLKIYSNDPDEGLVEVPLSGNGVSAETPPSEQIANILTFFDDSVSNGTLVGSGPGNSAKGRLGALRNMIEAAGDLINQGRIAEARQQLQDAYLRVDGQPKPPDFVTGAAAAQLASMIQQLINSLGG